MVRRTRTELYDTVERSKQIYSPLGWTFNETEKLWRGPDSARLRFAFLERDDDAMLYQGHAYTRLYVEEIGNFPSPDPIMRLMATLRSAHGVPVGFRATGNPGGPGHQWVKGRYIDPAPGGYVIMTDEVTQLQRVFIPAKVTDNVALMESDPGYIARLKASGPPALVAAWLDGDWDVIAGAFFSEWSAARHVIRPFGIPAHWARYRAGDWGSYRPFCIGWYAVSDGSIRGIARGALVKYREWYGMVPGQPNVGLKLTAEEVAAGILERESMLVEGKAKREEMHDAVLDPSAFSQDGGPSLAERMGNLKVWWRRADNKRVSQAGALGGWDQMRQRLKGDPDGPGILFFDTCIHTIRTIPALQHDTHRPEDVDTESEDHAGDETRYACMARPYTKDAPNIPAPKFPGEQTIAEIIKNAGKHRRELEE
jgi:hypothetical protein